MSRVHAHVRVHAGVPVNRRTFLVAGSLGYCGQLAVGGSASASAFACASASTSASASASDAAGAVAPGRVARPARSTILLWLSGGASHIDTWDMKPEAPADFRGEFRPIGTSAPGIQLCEHLPLLAQQAHHLAVVRSLGHGDKGTGDHHAGYYYNLTGHAPDPSFRALLNDRKPEVEDWPFLGTVVAAKRPPHPYLPQPITLPQKPGAPQYTRPGQFAARLGVQYDPVYVLGQREKPLEFAAPALALEGPVTADRLTSRRSLLGVVEGAVRGLDRGGSSAGYTLQQERAFALLGSAQARNAFDLSQEPESLRNRYGATVNGMSLLLARRLVEAGLPFVSVFWMEDPKIDNLCKSGGGWDTHGNNFNCLKDHLLPELDRGLSALLEDLHQRGLLGDTLVMVNSEMGRNPRIGDVRSGGKSGAGRDHWTKCMSVLLAGGGIQGGQAYGSSDRFAAYPADLPVGPEDIARTVYHAMGIEDLQMIDRLGRPFDLAPDGKPLRALFV